MSIPSDSYDTEVDSFRRMASNLRIEEANKEDESTVPQVKSVFQSFSPSLNSSTTAKSAHAPKTLAGRVTLGAPAPLSESLEVLATEEVQIEQEATIVEQLQKIDLEHYKAVESAIVENVQPEENYIIKIRNLIAELLGQLSRIAEKDRVQIDEMKTKYKKSSFDSSVLQRELGENGLLFSAIAFGAAFIPWGKDYEVVGKIFAENCCPKIGELFSSYKQSDKQKLDGLTSLLIQEYSAKTQKGQSDSSNKQELISMLERVLQSLKEAARAG